MKTESLNDLAREARLLRRQVVDMAYTAGSGHCGGSLSCAEILVTLYRRILRIKPDDPAWADRDRFVLSKGHAAPMHYAMLSGMGFFPGETLMSLRKFGSILQGHPDMRKVPGIEISSGSLGMGLSNGVGMAWSAVLQKKSWRVFVLTGDGELDEGQNWEAAMLASKFGLSNLILIVDYNRVQLDGPTDVVMPLGNLPGKFKAFGWSVDECDGHECGDLLKALKKGMEAHSPHAIIARTVKGKGVPYMEGDHVWHGKRISEEDYRKAMKILGNDNRENGL